MKAYTEILIALSSLIYSQISAVDQRELMNTYRKIRCPECRAQSIAESELPSAVSLRKEIETKLKDGWCEKDIIEIIKQIHGDQIVMTSEIRRNTMVLWVIPLLCLLGVTYRVASEYKR